MKKFKLTNSIESPAPSTKNLMYLSNALSKWQWLFLILSLFLVGVGCYYIGKYVGKQSKTKPKKKRSYRYTNYSPSTETASTEDGKDTSTSDSTE